MTSSSSSSGLLGIAGCLRGGVAVVGLESSMEFPVDLVRFLRLEPDSRSFKGVTAAEILTLVPETESGRVREGVEAADSWDFEEADFSRAGGA